LKNRWVRKVKVRWNDIIGSGNTLMGISFRECQILASFFDKLTQHFAIK
jgi:hypothetical protein